jgi:hypothetical protein
MKGGLMPAVDDTNYGNNYNDVHNMRRDVHDAHTNSQIAKLLSTLALIGAVIAIGLSMWALNKAGDAQSTANRAMETAQSRQP